MVDTVARKIRMGIVGEGQGACIGPVKPMAADLDGQVELVCGAFSSDLELANSCPEEQMLTPNRVYFDYPTMMASEAQLPKHKRMDFVCIVTPNHLHLPIARAALEAGFHVLCDKPATLNINEAKELTKLVKQSGCLFGLTHTYTGNPVAKVAHPFMSGFISHIARHTVKIVKRLIRKKITHVRAELSTFAAGRRLNDDGMMLIRVQDSINDALQARLIARDTEDQLKGYLQAFANIYHHFARAIRSHEQGQEATQISHWDYPKVAGAVRGMSLLEAFVENSQKDTRWYPMSSQTKKIIKG